MTLLNALHVKIENLKFKRFENHRGLFQDRLVGLSKDLAVGRGLVNLRETCWRSLME